MRPRRRLIRLTSTSPGRNGRLPSPRGSHVYNLTFLNELTATAQEQEQALQENLATTAEGLRFGRRDRSRPDSRPGGPRQGYNTVLIARQQYEQERLSLNQSIGFPPDMQVILRAELAALDRPYSVSRRNDGRARGQKARPRGAETRIPERGGASQRGRPCPVPFPCLRGLAVTGHTPVGTTGFSISLAIPLFDRNQGKIAIEKATRAQLFDEYMARLFEARSTIATTLADLRSTRSRSMRRSTQYRWPGSLLKHTVLPCSKAMRM